MKRITSGIASLVRKLSSSYEQMSDYNKFILCWSTVALTLIGSATYMQVHMKNYFENWGDEMYEILYNAWLERIRDELYVPGSEKEQFIEFGNPYSDDRIIGSRGGIMMDDESLFNQFDLLRVECPTERTYFSSHDTEEGYLVDSIEASSSKDSTNI